MVDLLLLICASFILAFISFIVGRLLIYFINYVFEE